MNFKDIYDIIIQLQNTSSTNDKLAILKENKDNELLKRVLEYTYNPFKRYKITEKNINPQEGVLSYNIFELLDVLAASNINDVLRHQTNSFLWNFSLYPQEFELYKMMILKDLKINLGVKSINKVWPKLIPEFNVMLAKKYFDNPTIVEGKEFVLTQKLDGYRLVAINNNGDIECYTRQGQLVKNLEDIERDLKHILSKNMVFDGELLAINDLNLTSKDLYRETIRRGRKKGIKTGLEYHVFDYLSLKDFESGSCKIPYVHRKQMLQDLLYTSEHPYIIDVPVLYRGTDTNQITKWLDYEINLDNEGVMINLSYAPYKCTRTDVILKVKKFKDCDVRVVNLIEGTGQNKGKLGAVKIMFTYKDKPYYCECGSGFSIEDRVEFWNNPKLILNKIITVKYFEISQNSKTKEYGLRFPVFKEVRNDKDEISMY